MATSFTVTLTGDQEVPARPTTAGGSGTVTWDAATNTATYEVVVEGLDFGPVLGMTPQTGTTADDVTNMHVHNGARGVNGPVVFGQIAPGHDADDLEIMEATPNGDGSWTISGSWEPSDPAAASITTFASALTAASTGQDVALYFNVHTTTWPGGEIRGQWVAAGAMPTPTPPSGAVDWNALAAVVQANFAATGHWFPGVDLPPGPVDWDAIAAEITENFEDTGQWFL